ncbi:MAG TPA: hypothetical protein VMW27_08465, partial [Thermoanaerobaculia bacterium]|nr:hypothetical protein [Thermoanaerobaculia bacterium]
MKASEADLAWPTARLLVLNLRTAGRYREALSWVERVLAVGPTGPQLGLALTFQSQLQRLAAIRGDEAESSLEKALELVEP